MAAHSVLSDLILAAQLISEARFPPIGVVIWLTCRQAQALIVYGTDTALAIDVR